jgi:hypothetical protein
MREDFKTAVNDMVSFLEGCHIVFDKNIIKVTNTNDMVHLRFHKHEDAHRFVANYFAVKGITFSYLETNGHTWMMTKIRRPFEYVVVNSSLDQITFAQSLERL